MLAIIIDAAVQANQVVSQRIIFSAPRGGARPGQCALYDHHLHRRRIGSVLGTITYFRGGWTATALVGGLAGALSLLLFAIQRRGQSVAAAGMR